MNGLDCIRLIRQYESEGTIVAHVPTIATTANARTEQISELVLAGMVSFCSRYNWQLKVPEALLIPSQDDVVSKPFLVGDLTPKIAALVRRYRVLA